MLILENLLNDLRRERDKAEEMADRAAADGDSDARRYHVGAQRAFRRAIEICEQYDGFPTLPGETIGR